MDDRARRLLRADPHPARRRRPLAPASAAASSSSPAHRRDRRQRPAVPMVKMAPTWFSTAGIDAAHWSMNGRVVGEECGHRASRRAGLQPRRHLRDVRPDLRLIGMMKACGLHRCGDLRHALRAPARILRPRSRCERSRPRAPSSGLDARHGNGQLRMRVHQDRQVDDPVLLRTNQLLAVDDQDAFRAAIDDAQIRDAALLRDFRHFHQARRQRIVQDAVARHSPRRPGRGRAADTWRCCGT